MSVSIPTAYVDQFSATVHLLAEQRMSRLRSSVQSEAVTGDSFSKDRIGSTQDEANLITSLHGDTPLNNTPHTRRWGFVSDYDVADLIDKQTRVKLLIDPDSSYTIRHAGVMGRQMDQVIIDAIEGTAKTGHTGTGSQALPSGQKIAHGSAGLTIAKLIEAKELLDASEVDDFFPRVFVCKAKQISDLLATTQVTSADFNTIQALVQGKVDTYMGFKFIRSERCTDQGSNITSCYAYASTAVMLGINSEPTSSADNRPDKRNAKQIYTTMSIGAVRVEDEQVVEVSCSEA